MDLSKISLEVDETIRKLVNRYNNMYNPSGQIAQIELDLLLEDTRLFYNKVKELSDANLQQFMKERLIVNQGNNSPAQPTPDVASGKQASTQGKNIPLYKEKEPNEGVIPGEIPVEEEIPISPVMNKKMPEPPSQPEPKEQITTVEDLRTVKQDTVYAPVSDDARKPVKAEKTNILASKFQSNSPLAEKFGQTGTDNINTQHKIHHKIASLKNAISFGDRFLFISELFGGNDGAFDYTIAQLNECGDRSEAMDLFNSICDRKKWNPDSEAVSRLLELVERRFQ